MKLNKIVAGSFILILTIQLLGFGQNNDFTAQPPFAARKGLTSPTQTLQVLKTPLLSGDRIHNLSNLETDHPNQRKEELVQTYIDSGKWLNQFKYVTVYDQNGRN